MNLRSLNLPPTEASPRLNVGIIGSRGFPSTYGGFETLVRVLAPYLVKRGHRVTVYGRGGAKKTAAEHDGVFVVNTRGIDSKSASTGTHGLTAALHAARERHDVALVLNVANGPILPILRAAKIPIVLNVDGIEWERAKWGPAARTAFRIGAQMSGRFADVLIADSLAIGARWSSDLGVDPIFVPYGADLAEEVSDDDLEAYGLEAGRYVLAVARLAPENNVEVLLDAMESLEWQLPTVIVGSANYDNPVLKRLALLAQSGRIIWLGHVDDQELLLSLWANCGVYYHGHSAGGTNPALLQALGAGAPTVAVDTVYNREVLGGMCGALVDPSWPAVAEAVARLYSDRTTRAAYAAAGRRLVGSRYRWDDVCRSYEHELLRASGLHRCEQGEPQRGAMDERQPDFCRPGPARNEPRAPVSPIEAPK